jgi:hypothetical protein
MGSLARGSAAKTVCVIASPADEFIDRATFSRRSTFDAVLRVTGNAG